jgi:hypothetical protein
LVRAGELLDIEVLDHLIIGQGRCLSLKRLGLGLPNMRQSGSTMSGSLTWTRILADLLFGTVTLLFTDIEGSRRGLCRDSPGSVGRVQPYQARVRILRSCPAPHALAGLPKRLICRSSTSAT